MSEIDVGILREKIRQQEIDIEDLKTTAKNEAAKFDVKLSEERGI